MGNNSSKSSHKKRFCCFCTLSKSYSSSSFSIDDKYFPTFDRLPSNGKKLQPAIDLNYCSASLHNVTSDKKSIPRNLSPRIQSHSLLENKKQRYNSSSIKDLEKSFHGTDSIDQWIDSLPILGTPALNRPKTNQVDLTIKHSLTIGNEQIKNNINRIQENESMSVDNNEQFACIFRMKSNRQFTNFAKKYRLNFYLTDFLNRLKSSNSKQTFKNHFLPSAIIYPCNGINQLLTDDLNLFIISPSESILPNLSINTNSLYKIHEQIRSKCYFIPLTNCKIEPNDDEYKEKLIQLDRTHVVITLENNETNKTNKISMESESSFLFTSNDSFQTGFICVNQENISKQFLPFVYHSSDENLTSLSSNLIQQWFNTLILVNQTCAIAQRFLTGDGSHITCLLKNQLNNENSSQFHHNLTFAALRLPPCTNLNDSSNLPDENSDKIIDAFSSTFLSDNKKTPNDTIHIDYEQYSFAFLLYRWPKCLIDNYYTHPTRYSKRKWPTKYHMNILIKSPLFLLPKLNTNQWEINFDLIEKDLFQLLNESTLFFYILLQQLFSPTYSIRILIKHCFLNYSEKYGLPFSNPENNLIELIKHFLKDIFGQIKRRFIPNYFNHQINLLNSNENYNQWFDFIENSIQNQTYLSCSSSMISKTNRSMISEFLFYFIDQLYQTFHLKRSQFYINDKILIDLHKQLCEKLSNDTSNNQNILIEKCLNKQEIIENIQKYLTYNFETNAELVHNCLNQIRKAQTSLIFHYTWTIYIQYLHTYYNVLWNM